MFHITSRSQLLNWLSEHAPNKVVQRAIDRGHITVHGLFKGGWVVEAKYHGQNYVVGIKPIGVNRRLVCGLLKQVPTEDYVGGESELAKGDGDGKSMVS